MDNDVPPVDALYHATVPPVGATAVIVTFPVSQREPLVTVGAAGRALMVNVTDLRAADKQPLVKFLDATQ